MGQWNQIWETSDSVHVYYICGLHYKTQCTLDNHSIHKHCKCANAHTQKSLLYMKQASVYF